MKKIYSLLLTLSLSLTAAWASSVEFTPANSGGWSATQGEQTGTLDDVTITCGNGVAAAELRIYKNQTLTVSVSSGSITSIVFTCTANGTSKYGPGCFAELDGYSYSGNTGTWTGSAESVSFTASSNQVRATSIVVTYTSETAASAINVNPTSVSIAAEGIELGEVAVSYTGISDMDMVSEVVLYNDEACTDLFTGDWFTAAYNADKSAIEYIASANTGDARTLYIYLYAIDDNAVEVEKIIAVSQDAYVAPFASLPFAFDGGKADIAKTSGMWHKGLGSDYSASPKLKFDTENDSLVIAFDAVPGALSFDIKGTSSNGTFQGALAVKESADGETYTTVAEYTSLATDAESKSETLASDTRYVLFVMTQKVSGCNVGLGNISIAAASGTDIENISSSLQGGERGRLIINNGQLFILRGEHMYNAAGMLVK